MFKIKYQFSTEDDILKAKYRQDFAAYTGQYNMCVDLRAAIDEPILIYPEQTIMVDSGVAMQAQLVAQSMDFYYGIHAKTNLPTSSWITDCQKSEYILSAHLELHPRSGLGAKHGIVLGNLTGIIDQAYNKPIQISVWNRNPVGTPAFTINPHDRIAQIKPVYIPMVEMVEEQLTDYNRGDGFGSSGKQ